MNPAASIVRLHIVLIAMAAAVVMGWLMSGQYLWGVAFLGGLDWLLINLLNRITDLEEDVANAVPGAATVGRHRRAFLGLWWVAQLASFAGGAWLLPELVPYRLAVQAIGFGYSYRVVPTWRGLRRFKDLYFLKNFMSAMLFVLTVFIYPLAATGGRPGELGPAGVLVLIGFFVTFEITYEVIYDLRDIEGDAQLGVPTYPVVHGAHRSRQIIDALLVASVVLLVVGFVTGVLGAREALFAAAPAVQFVVYRRSYARGVSSIDCVRITHLGTALLVVFLAGTHLWLRAGLPANIRLGV